MNPVPSGSNFYRLSNFTEDLVLIVLELDHQFVSVDGRVQNGTVRTVNALHGDFEMLNEVIVNFFDLLCLNLRNSVLSIIFQQSLHVAFVVDVDVCLQQPSQLIRSDMPEEPGEPFTLAGKETGQSEVGKRESQFSPKSKSSINSPLPRSASVSGRNLVDGGESQRIFAFDQVHLICMDSRCLPSEFVELNPTFGIVTPCDESSFVRTSLRRF